MKQLFLLSTLFLLTACSVANETFTTSDERIEVSSPLENQSISSPFTVSGKARGYWFFEATAPLLIVDWDGRIIGQSYIQATDEWMTEDFVEFTGEIEFEVPEDIPYRRGSVIFQRSNPSDLPQNDAAVEIPILFE